MTIIFFGSDPWFSPPVLEALLKAGHEVLTAVTRGEALAKFKTVQAKTEEDILLERLAGLIRPGLAAVARPGLSKPDVIVLAAFGPPFLPAEVLNWPKFGCLNVHASLLPSWRGASPVFGAIANGDKETGVSIMKMTEEIDLGSVLGQTKTVIRPGLATQGRAFTNYDTRETLTRRLGMLGGKLIVETLKKLENGQVNEVKQPSKSPTPYTHRLTKDLGRIDWKKSPEEIERFIRAVTPWPGAWTEVKFEIRPPAWTSSMRSRAGNLKFEIKELKILKAHLEESSQQQDCHTPQSGVRNDGFLIIDEVQLPGKNPISWKQFLAGHQETKLI